MHALFKVGVMVLHKLIILLVLECIELELVFSAPCNGLSSTNSTPCTSNNHKNLGNKTANTLPRIITSPTSTADQESLLSSLLGDNMEASFDNQEIIFPDSFESVFKPPVTRLETAPPQCTDGLSLCEDIETYPYNRLKDILKKSNTHNEFFGVDEAPPEIANRIGEPEENFICASIDSTIFPKAGRNKNNKWKYIINQGEREGYIQGIRIEKCLKLNGPCNLVTDAPIGYVASCKQKYVLRRLLSLAENGQPIPDSFHIPSACCCSFKKDSSFLSNFGKSMTPAVAPGR